MRFSLRRPVGLAVATTVVMAGSITAGVALANSSGSGV